MQYAHICSGADQAATKVRDDRCADVSGRWDTVAQSQEPRLTSAEQASGNPQRRVEAWCKMSNPGRGHQRHAGLHPRSCGLLVDAVSHLGAACSSSKVAVSAARCVPLTARRCEGIIMGMLRAPGQGLKTLTGVLALQHEAAQSRWHASSPRLAGDGGATPPAAGPAAAVCSRPRCR